jgi:hypothetical protein
VSQTQSPEPPHATDACTHPDEGRPVLAGKRRTVREDGRYVIYYEFDPAKPTAAVRQ